MKFVVSKSGTSNPEVFGIEIPPSTPGFTHARTFPKGFRFELTDEFKIQKVKEGLFTIVDDDSTKSRMEIAKIDAEVKEEERIRKLEVAKEVAKKAAEEAKNRPHKEWFERPVGIVILLVIAAVIACLITDMIFPQWFHSQKP